MKSSPKFEYRVIWKRKGLSRKFRPFARLEFAKRYSMLLGPEPWKYSNNDPDDYKCCSGFECSCGGQTWREESEYRNKNQPPIEFLLIERRHVGDWEPDKI